MQLSASAKRPALSNWTSYSTSSPSAHSRPQSSSPPPAPVKQTMPVVSRNSSALTTLPYVAVEATPILVTGRRGGRTESRRHRRRRCQLVHPKTLLALSFFSFCLVVYWSYTISSITFGVDALMSRTRADSWRTDQVDIDLNQVTFF